MKKNYFLIILVVCFGPLVAQNTYDDIYDLFQNNCTSCHNNTSSAANLDLEGAGATVQAKMADVYANLYKQNPSNSAAASKKNHLIYPGDPYKSFLYRKIDNGLTPGLSLHAGEGVSEPNGMSALSDKEIELVRQWILYGAQETGTYFDKSLLEDFYDNGGVESVTNPPAPPADGEGFQIHLGPFFLEPGGEIEYFSKYEPLFDSDIEIHKLQTEMGSYSHHYIAYKFSSTFGNVNPANVPYGMREGQDFDGRELISVDQYSSILNLPKGSAFKWDQNTVLDLNTHYINYSNTQVLKCEVYHNIYTQDLGTANQEMQVALIPNVDIPIPNDNIPVTFSHDFQLGANIDMFVWGFVAHTHKYGKDFNLYLKNPNGSRGEQIYDAGCVDGEPGCTVEDFDYTHLPVKFNYPFLKVNVLHGVEAEATYQNDGPVPVNWGFTSDDEMMIFVAFYVADTTGVDMSGNTNPPPNAIGLATETKEFISFYPNPSDNLIFVENKSKEHKSFAVTFYDYSGKKIYTSKQDNSFSIDVSSWQAGLYFYEVISDTDIVQKGKLLKK